MATNTLSMDSRLKLRISKQGITAYRAMRKELQSSARQSPTGMVVWLAVEARTGDVSVIALDAFHFSTLLASSSSAALMILRSHLLTVPGLVDRASGRTFPGRKSSASPSSRAHRGSGRKRRR